MSDGLDPIAKAERVVVAGFAAANCDLWARASRCNLERVRAMVLPAERIERAGDQLLGIIALDQALLAARYLIANDAPATADVPIPDLDRRWRELRQIRNVAEHMFDTIGTPPPPDVLERIRTDDWLDLVEWADLLDALEPWAARHARLSRGMSDRPAQRPPKKPPAVTSSSRR